MKIPFERGDVLSYFNNKYKILKLDYKEDGTIIEVCCSPKDYAKYKQFIIEE